MYVTIRGRVEMMDDASYERQVKKDGVKVKETVMRYEMSLTIPESTEPIRVSLAGDAIPSQQQMDDWELNMKWVEVPCDGWRHMTGTTDDRAWSMVSFTASELPKELSQDDQKQLMQRRKAKKAKQKELSKQRKAQQQTKQSAA